MSSFQIELVENNDPDLILLVGVVLKFPDSTFKFRLILPLGFVIDEFDIKLLCSGDVDMVSLLVGMFNKKS